MSHQKVDLYILLGGLYIVVAKDDEAPSTSSQIVELNEVIKKVIFFYQGLLKLNDSSKNKEQGYQTQFSIFQINTIEKENKMDLPLTSICLLPIYYTN